jgi:hypothetical protein
MDSGLGPVFIGCQARPLAFPAPTLPPRQPRLLLLTSLRLLSLHDGPDQKPIHAKKTMQKTISISEPKASRLSSDQTVMTYLILIADDDDRFRRSLARILDEAGYSVAEAATGNQAFAKVNHPARKSIY